MRIGSMNLLGGTIRPTAIVKANSSATIVINLIIADRAYVDTWNANAGSKLDSNAKYVLLKSNVGIIYWNTWNCITVKPWVEPKRIKSLESVRLRMVFRIVRTVSWETVYNWWCIWFQGTLGKDVTSRIIHTSRCPVVGPSNKRKINCRNLFVLNVADNTNVKKLWCDTWSTSVESKHNFNARRVWENSNEKNICPVMYIPIDNIIVYVTIKIDVCLCRKIFIIRQRWTNVQSIFFVIDWLFHRTRKTLLSSN